MFKLSILLSLSFSTVSLADTPATQENPAPATENSEPTVTEGDPAQEEVAPAQEAVAELRLAVEVTLSNGIILTGTANQTDVIMWVQTDPLTLYMSEDNEITLEGAQISSIRLVPATPDPIVVEQPALEAAMEPPAESNPASMPTAPEQPAAPVLTWEPYTSPSGFSHPNPAGGRYVYAPTAIPMQQGQAYLSQKYGLISSAAFAITDNLALVFGTFILFPPALTVFGGKYAFEVSEDVHIGFGGEVFMFPIEGELLGTIGFTNITIGDLDNNLTFAVGALSSEMLDTELSMPVMVGFQRRINNKMALVSENWLIFDLDGSNSPLLMNALTMRFLGERADESSYGDRWRTERGFPKKTWDLGFVMFAGEGEFIGPMPWVDWSFHFGPLSR